LAQILDPPLIHIKKGEKHQGRPISIQLFPDYFGATKQLKKISHFKNRMPSALACVNTKNKFEKKKRTMTFRTKRRTNQNSQSLKAFAQQSP